MVAEKKTTAHQQQFVIVWVNDNPDHNNGWKFIKNLYSGKIEMEKG